MLVFNMEYVKFISCVLAGFAAAKAWFNREISMGKAVIKHYESLIASKVKQAETAVVTEVKKIESKL